MFFFQANTSVTSLGSAVMCALVYRSLKCMKLLIKVSILWIIFPCDVVFAYSAISTWRCHHEHNFAQFFSQAGADVNCNGSMLTPLLLATMHGGYTNFIKLLLKAGADPNIPDDVCVLYILLIFADLVCRISLYTIKSSGDAIIQRSHLAVSLGCFVPLTRWEIDACA